MKEGMEQDLNYIDVTFQANHTSAQGFFTAEKTQNMEVIYDEVKTGETSWGTHPTTSDNKSKPTLHGRLGLAAASLGIICLILVFVITSLSIFFTQEQRIQSMVTAQNQQLQTEKAALQRQMQNLSRDRDRMNWTIAVIMDYQNFPVTELCPQKVCKPCLDGWVLFQSNCYLFTKDEYFKNWKTWKKSQEFCKEKNADLVVIETLEEQEFIINNTSQYDSSKHGYWIGLSKTDSSGAWVWVNGGNFTMMLWATEEPGYTQACALSKPQADPAASWDKASCTMRNRWICETRALIKPD
ncbi:C-type lectin domain family 12 member B isoform X1 [Oryzias melastigma]|uniref:C-type lectin domain family 12 member B isoform X1 n=1 Tax=Oryzias melastigma TaxID=30732 RepID=UPI000CF8364B|nr:C-type lectin domain family 12 member B isoform X1 [Oryzias melastigma]XP_024114250.1 C-type lectin domain family 12 member B isoform X1 [Oryzias melastigma]XP_036071635.1 C-type lectin domain family 12 member B isoform X1 [Oryzias melastigma]